MFDCISAAGLLTLCLPVTSADNLGKQFGPRSGPTSRRAWSGSKLFDILMVFLKEFFQKNNFEKNQQTTKKHEKLPSRQWVNQVWLYLLQMIPRLQNQVKRL